MGIKSAANRERTRGGLDFGRQGSYNSKQRVGMETGKCMERRGRRKRFVRTLESLFNCLDRWVVLAYSTKTTGQLITNV